MNRFWLGKATFLGNQYRSGRTEGSLDVRMLICTGILFASDCPPVLVTAEEEEEEQTTLARITAKVVKLNVPLSSPFRVLP